jgi:hypothetical protein
MPIDLDDRFLGRVLRLRLISQQHEKHKEDLPLDRPDEVVEELFLPAQNPGDHDRGRLPVWVNRAIPRSGGNLTDSFFAHRFSPAN